jgi:ubiquinone/menaquinone biosynthesis C-methylase UbiE
MKDTAIAKIVSSLICPVCSERLQEISGNFTCTACKKKYGRIGGIPVLIAKGSNHKTKEAAYHSSISPSYGDLHQLNSYRNRSFHLQALKTILSLPLRSAVLELGCGTGFDAIPLLAEKHLVVETDIAPGQVKEAKKQIRQAGLSDHALFYVADAENIPFDDETFDASLIVAALHHLEHPCKALQEMRRCTRGGGSIVIAMEPNTREWVKVLSIPFSMAKFVAFRTVGKKQLKRALKRADAFREPTIERTFTRREIVDLVREAGFTIKKVEPMWFLCGFIQWFVTLLNKLSTRRWSLNSDVERCCVHLDRMIAAIPLINSFCCNWTLHCTKE